MHTHKKIPFLLLIKIIIFNNSEEGNGMKKYLNDSVKS